MGKKTKSRDEIEGPSSKRTKTVGHPGRDPPGPLEPQIQIRYEDMPANHKRKFYIYDDCGGSLKKYIEVISWLRSMGCFLGSMFDDIPNLNWSSGKGYPLVEIEVITPQDLSVKFIIFKNNLYLVAFSSSGKWFQFHNCGVIIYGFNILDGINGSYTSSPWEYVGPEVMIEAVNALASRDQAPIQDKKYVRAWEVFFFHLSEAGRYYAVESLVCKSLAPTPARCEKHTHKDEEDAILIMTNRKAINPKDDIYCVVEADGCVDFQRKDKAPDYFRELVKQFKNLSKVWYISSLSKGTLFPVNDNLISRCNMRSRKSLRCTLAVLCNSNLGRAINDYRKKLSPEIIKEMETKVLELQEKGEVLLPLEDRT